MINTATTQKKIDLYIRFLGEWVDLLEEELQHQKLQSEQRLKEYERRIEKCKMRLNSWNDIVEYLNKD